MDSRDRTIARLALPALATLAVEPLYVLVDTAIVGHLGTTPLGGLALASTVLNAAFLVCNFLAYGTTARVAYLTGSGDRRAAARLTATAAWLAVGAGAVLTAVIAVCAAPLASALGGAGPVKAAAVTYLRISALGGPLVLVALVGNGYLRGVHDMRTPMVIVVTANVINVAVEVVFVYVLHLGIAGSAWGTVLAQAMAAVWFLAVLAPRVAEWGATRSLDVGELGRLLRFGRHLFVRTASLLGTFTLATAVAARVGRTTLAGHHLALQLDLFLALVVDCLAVAGQALVGTALGRGDGDDARAWGRRLLRLGSAAGAALAIALLALSGAIPHAFSSDAGVVGRARLAIAVLALMQLPGAVAFVLDGVLIGAADTRFQQWANVAAFIVFAPFGIAVLRWHALGIAGIWTGLFAWMATRALANAWRFRGAGWTTAALRPGGGRRQPSPRESP